ncbi:hypothetical protein TNCV_4673721 [Trichonephila clavipes]|nr:hypothetical protein TNCV_4673721 [Trichonephila clavipes]
MHNATFQQPLNTVSPKSNPTIVMLKAEAGFVSKHNVSMKTVPCIIGGVNTCDSQSTVNKARGILRTYHFAANRIQSFLSGHRMMHAKLICDYDS